MSRGKITAGLVVIAAVMSAAPPALASRLDVWGGPVYVYTADPGEANRLTVREEGSTLTLEDPGAVINAAPGCTIDSPTRVTCALADGSASFGGTLGDGNDEVTLMFEHGGHFDVPDAGGNFGPWGVHAGPGDDTMHGSVVEDDLDGGPGDDVVDGGGDTDYLQAGAGNDRLDGGPGDDHLRDADFNDPEPPADADRDVFSGGAGYDVLSEEKRSDAQRFTFDGAANDGAAGEGDNVGADVESLSTGRGDDTVVAPASGLVVATGEGDDTVVGGIGRDQIYGGPGADSIDGGAGNDSVSGGADGDHLAGGPDQDIIEGDGPGSPGDDTIDARDGSIVGDPLRAPDWVMCGGGTDTYLPDYGDYQQLAPIDSCEDVTVPPDPLHSLIPSPAAAAAAKTAWLGVRCPFSGSGICAGRLRLISTRRPARELAVGRLRLAPGSTATVELRLAPAARKALAHERTLKARAVVSTGSAGKDFKLPGSVTLRRKHR